MLEKDDDNRPVYFYNAGDDGDMGWSPITRVDEFPQSTGTDWVFDDGCNPSAFKCEEFEVSVATDLKTMISLLREIREILSNDHKVMSLADLQDMEARN